MYRTYLDDILLLLPKQSSGVIAVIGLYLDESGTDAGSAKICVAGYVYSPEQAKKAEQEWTQHLSDFGVPYFHMSELAHASRPHYDKLNKAQRIDLGRKMIGVIRRRVEIGIGVSVSPEIFNQATTAEDRRRFGNAYSMCCYMCFNIVGGWVRQHFKEDKVAYFLEAGHAQEREMRKLLLHLADPQSAQIREDLQWGSDTFAKKREMPLLQTADLLARQYRKMLSRVAVKQGPRLDFAELVKTRHIFCNIDENILEGVVSHTRRVYDAMRDGSSLDLYRASEALTIY